MNTEKEREEIKYELQKKYGKNSDFDRYFTGDDMIDFAKIREEKAVDQLKFELKAADSVNEQLQKQIERLKDGICKCPESDKIGSTKLWCCNMCGKRQEEFYNGELSQP